MAMHPSLAGGYLCNYHTCLSHSSFIPTSTLHTSLNQLIIQFVFLPCFGYPFPSFAHTLANYVTPCQTSTHHSLTDSLGWAAPCLPNPPSAQRYWKLETKTAESPMKTHVHIIKRENGQTDKGKCGTIMPLLPLVAKTRIPWSWLHAKELRAKTRQTA